MTRKQINGKIKSSRDWTPLFLALIGLLLYSIGLDKVHLFDWDEINFAESAREMIVSGNYLDVQINFETFWEKPPLFVWMQVLSMKLWGVGEMGARFPNAVAGAITLATLYLIGKRVRGSKAFGLLWAALYSCSLLPFFYFKTGIMDPWFNLFIFLSIYYATKYTTPLSDGVNKGHNRRGNILMSALFVGLATLVKGPVSLLILGLVGIVVLIWERAQGRRLHFKWIDLLLFVAVYAVVGGLWFILQILNGHWSIIQDFIVYQIRLFETQDAGHGGFPMYHIVILFFGVFPASLFALPTIKKGVLKSETSTKVAHLFRVMMATLWVVLILFSIVQTKIVHYSSMCYFPITFLAAYYLSPHLKANKSLPQWLTALVVTIGAVIALILMTLTFIDQYVDEIKPMVDEFTRGNLSSDGGWKGHEWIAGFLLLIGVVLFAILVRKDLTKGLASLLGGCFVAMSLGVLWVVPRVEAYSQRALIEFCKARKGENCYILPLFKSYAHYFYSDRQPENNCADEELLISGEIDKPTYFVIKMTKEGEQEFRKKSPDAVRLYDKNGFLFYARYPEVSIENEPIK